MSKYIEPKVLSGWRKGPPPCVGWWPASVLRNTQALRWWDGKQWSWAADHGDNAKQAASMSRLRDNRQVHIEWCDRWWEVKP